MDLIEKVKLNFVFFRGDQTTYYLFPLLFWSNIAFLVSSVVWVFLFSRFLFCLFVCLGFCLFVLFWIWIFKERRKIAKVLQQNYQCS